MNAKRRGGKRRKMGPWPRLQKFWDIRAACNFIGGGTGSGLLFIASVLIFMGKMYPAVIVTGMVFVSFGLIMVFWEIGKPWRSINVFFHPQTSWMTREGILVIPMFLSAGLLLFNFSVSIGYIAAAFMGISALAFIYCQVRILHAARGIPSWCSPALKPYMFTTSLVEAMAVVVCIGPGIEKGLWGTLIVLLLLRVVFWKIYTNRLYKDGAPDASCRVLDSMQTTILISHITALALLMAALLRDIPQLSIFAGIILAIIGWYIKVVLITKAAQTRGFAIPRTPVRGKGKSRILSRQR